MPATLRFFQLPEDEVAMFRQLAPRGLTIYPELVPEGWAPISADEHAPAKLDALGFDACYLAAEQYGDVVAHPVKRGRDKGMLEIEEVRSPVFHLERSRKNEAGELVAGRLWAELVTTDDPTSRKGKPLGLSQIFDQLHGWLRKTFRRSDPKGFWVGPKAAAACKGGLVLREPGHKGDAYGVWR
jgi:hypothetical protein